MKAIYILKVIALIALIVWLLILTSCSKQYVENASCYRYLELSDKYTSEMVFVKTDTLWPGGRQATYACDDELKKIQDYVPRMEGCATGGYQIIHYVIIK